MKKFTPLLLVLLLAFLVSAQSQTNKNHSLKGNGEVFYTTTFDWENPDDPKGWTAPEGFYMEDPDDNGLNWHWTPNDSLNSKWVSEPPFESSSREDGHLALLVDAYQSHLPDEEFVSVNNSVVFPTFDCSDKTSVLVRYETTFMNYSSGWTMSMMLSRDAGAHWAVFDVSFGCGHKDRPDDTAPGQPAIFEANVSEVAAGASELIIKFLWLGAEDYFWLIDDFQLAEAWDNDLIMEHYVLEWDDGNEATTESYFYNIPISQLGGSFTNFESSVFNMGEFDQYGVHLDIDIVKNNQSIWNVKSEADYLPTLLLDTTLIEEAFTPTEFGHYKITFDYVQEENEQTPENDMAVTYFNVTDSVYSRADDSAEEGFAYGFEAYGEEGVPNEQHFMGVVFPIYGDCEVNSVSVFIAGGLADEQIEFRTALYWVPPAEEEDDTPVELLLSEIVTLDSVMHGTWVTLPFEKDGESEFLKAGDVVYAGVDYWNWHTEVFPYKRYLNLALGSDVGIQLNDPVAVCRSGPEAGFGPSIAAQKKLMVRLNINDHSNEIDGIDQTIALNKLGQNFPNPAENLTEISYELGSAENVEIEITDMTGRSVMTLFEGNLPAGKHTSRLDVESLDSGIYFYTLKAGDYVETKRMTVR